MNKMNQTPHILFSSDSPNKRWNWEPEHIIGGDGDSNKSSMPWGLGQCAFNSNSLNPILYENTPRPFLNKLGLYFYLSKKGQWVGKIPGLGRSPGEGNGNPLQLPWKPYCLENPMDRGGWKATVHGVAKSQTRWSNFTFTFKKGQYRNSMNQKL